MVAETVKISYHAATMRVRCEFTRAQCLASEAPPADTVKRAKAKLEAVKAAGEVAFFVVYETRLKECWRLLREAEGDSPDRVVYLTLAGGAPQLPGLEIEPGTAEKVLITIASQTTVGQTQGWKWDWFKMWAHRRLRELGIKEALNNAQLFSAFMKIRQEGQVGPQPIGANPIATAAATAGKAFSVIGNKQRREIGVLLRNVAELRDKAPRDAMLSLISQAVRQMSVGGVDYHLLKKEFLAALQSSIDGPEGLGLELPMVLLAATGSEKAAVAAEPEGPGSLQFQVTDDRMEATISGFAMAYYDDPQLTLDLDWITRELTRHGLLVPMAADVAKGLNEVLHRRQDLNGVIAARGQRGQPGKGPYLHPSYKDAESRSSANLDDEKLNIRDLQQRSTVKAGQLVAELRYKTPVQPGRNVYNEEVLPSNTDTFDVQVGEGIQQQAGHRYVALVDGMPKIEKNTIALLQILVHEGDVNLSTGNIVFDGPVEVTGSIDSGAYVHTTGDLTVKGSVTGARLDVRGNLTVMSGISTGTHGLVEVRGDMKAEFIEQSVIVCKGNLTVQKAILNSQLYVTGEVKVVSEGSVISGGKIVCLDCLTTGNLGTQWGAITEVNVGIDWKVVRSVEIKQKRAAKIQKRLQDDRLTLRDLVQKRADQLTARHKEMKEELQERLVRLRALAEKLEALAQKMTSELSYSSTARMFVHETLYTNVSITLCGQVIAIANDVANVAILPKRRRGSFIVPLEEIAADQEAGRDATRPHKRTG